MDAKVFRFVAPELSIDIIMPLWLFLFFKKFATVKRVKDYGNFQGTSLDIVYFDEEVKK